MLVSSNFPKPSNDTQTQKDILWEFTQAKKDFVNVQKVLAEFGGAFEDLARLLKENPGNISIDNWASVLDIEKLRGVLTEYDLVLREVQVKESKAQRLGCWVQ